MRNMFFPEEITEDDLYFVCYIIERTARHLQQRNKYVVNALGYDELYRPYCFRYGSGVLSPDSTHDVFH